MQVRVTPSVADVRESWRTERINAAVYDAGVERERVARLMGGLIWGTDTRRMFASIDELGSEADGTAILDLPCGGGLALRGLRPEQAVRYVAADISPYMLERAGRQAARRGLDRVEFVEADAMALPFENGSFDLCLSYNGLHCLPEQQPALAEIARVLRPAGRLRGTAVVNGRGLRQDALIQLFRRASAFGETTTAAELRLGLEDAGLENISVEASGALAHFSARQPR
jgi:ubiquinone/menaquinone biosynthesis C-methylase UbiE